VQQRLACGSEHHTVDGRLMARNKMFRHFSNTLRAYRPPVLGLGLSVGIWSLHRHAFFTIQLNDDDSDHPDSNPLISSQHLVHSGPVTRTFSQSRYGGTASSSSTESIYGIGSAVIHEESHTPGYGGIARVHVAKISS
jgi:hypothetical protein